MKTIISTIVTFSAALLLICGCGGEAETPFSGISAQLSETAGALPLRVEYSVGFEAEEPPVSVVWDFGDGTSSDTSFGEHLFTEPGEFAVTVSLTDARGLSRVREVGTVRVARPDGMIAWIETDGPTEGTTPLTVTFTARAWGAFGALEAEWEMGDGFIRKGMTVTHDFCSEGPFQPVLRVKDQAGKLATAICSADYSADMRTVKAAFFGLSVVDPSTQEFVTNRIWTVMSDGSGLTAIGPEPTYSLNSPVGEESLVYYFYGGLFQRNFLLSADGNSLAFTAMTVEGKTNGGYRNRMRIFQTDLLTGETGIVQRWDDDRFFTKYLTGFSDDGSSLGIGYIDYPDPYQDFSEGSRLTSVEHLDTGRSSDFEFPLIRTLAGDGRHALVRWFDGAVYQFRVLDVQSGELIDIPPFDNPGFYAYKTDFSCSRVLYMGADQDLYLWDIRDGTRKLPIDHYLQWPGVAYALSADGRKIMYASVDASTGDADALFLMYVEDYSTKSLPMPNPVVDVRFSPDGSIVGVTEKRPSIAFQTADGESFLRLDGVIGELSIMKGY